MIVATTTPAVRAAKAATTTIPIGQGPWRRRPRYQFAMVLTPSPQRARPSPGLCASSGGTVFVDGAPVGRIMQAHTFLPSLGSITAPHHARREVGWRRMRFVTALLLCLFGAVPTHAANRPTDDDVQQTVTQEVQNLLRGAGAAVAVRIDGRTLFFNFGFADRASGRPVTSELGVQSRLGREGIRRNLAGADGTRGRGVVQRYGGRLYR